VAEPLWKVEEGPREMEEPEPFKTVLKGELIEKNGMEGLDICFLLQAG
jgi:hypothetical protein